MTIYSGFNKLCVNIASFNPENTLLTVKLSNKLGRLIKNLPEMSSEEISNRLHQLAGLSESSQDPEICYIHRQFERAASSIIGILSQQSLANLQTWLDKCHAFLKGYELLKHAQESGYIDDWLFEACEPFVDIETGYIIPEINTEFRDKVLQALMPYAHDEDLTPAMVKHLGTPLLKVAKTQIKASREKYYQEMRQKLADDIEGFTEKQLATRKEIKRQSRSAQKYFTADDDPVVMAIAGMMTVNRMNLPAVGELQLKGIPARAIICAATQAISQANQHFGLAIPPQTREKIVLGETTVHWQNKPFANNRGNLIIAGLGRYGYFNSRGQYDSVAILSLIEEVTNHGISEADLADMMIKFSREGQRLTCARLNLSPSRKNQAFVDRLNKLLFLTSCAEIWRYMPQINPAEVEVTRVAFANAHARALTLISDGKLSMRDVFDEDAAFGLPTSTRITHPDNLPKIVAKLIDLNDLYHTEVVIEYDHAALEFLARFPDGAVANFTAAHLFELREHYGKMKITDECDSSDDETDSYLY